METNACGTDSRTELLGEATNENIEKHYESSRDFQNFIYDLFEKNGVLNDLRAHLRGHIVEVLKNSQADKPLLGQKNFKQRLELGAQAINMLIAEYLLSMEFNYSLSVFLSEIPLANMVFSYAKSLLQMNSDTNITALRFKDSDVWFMLNYLGIPLEGDTASQIVNMYKNNKLPLISCIFKCISFNTGATCDKDQSSDASLSSSVQSSDSDKQDRQRQSRHMSQYEKCRHQMYCKSCKNKMVKLKDKCKKRTEMFKNYKEASKNNSAELLLDNIGKAERSIIKEMFKQLESVYAAKVESVRTEERRKHRQHLEGQLQVLRLKKKEMEQSYSDRSQELEQNVQQRKRFLWELAASLREQHKRVDTAMGRVSGRAKELGVQEETVKQQLLEAEEVIRKKGEDVRAQIQDEIKMLAEQLDTLKKEKDTFNLNSQRSDSNMKNSEPGIKSSETGIKYSESRINDSESGFNHSESNCSEPVLNRKIEEINYETIKKEIALLKKHLKCVKFNKCCGLKNSLNESNGINLSLNNMPEMDKSVSDERLVSAKLGPNQLVNDLTKTKNVNFEQPCIEVHRNHAMDVTSEENESISVVEKERIKTLARQQQEELNELKSQYHRLQVQLLAANHELQALRAERNRDRANGNTEPFYVTLQRAGTSAGAHVDGAGEETRAIRGGSTANGFVCHRQVTGVGRFPPCRIMAKKEVNSSCNVPGVTGSKFGYNAENRFVNKPLMSSTPVHELPSKETPQVRSPNPPMQAKPSNSADPPSQLLREAKLRLKKLEIEAEAVTQSYMNFRKARDLAKDDFGTEDAKHAQPKVNITDQTKLTRRLTQNNDPAALLKQYNDNSSAYFRNRNRIENFIQPIPKAFTEIDRQNDSQTSKYNYLETPLSEFRKLYNTGKVGSDDQEKNEVDDNKEKEPKINVVETKLTVENDVVEKIIDDNGATIQIEDRVEKLTERNEEENKPVVEVSENKENEINTEETIEIPTNDIAIVDDMKLTEVSQEAVIDLVETNVKLDEKPHHSETTLPRVRELVEIMDNNTANPSEDSINNLKVYIEQTVDTHKLEESDVDGEVMATEMTIIITPKRDRLVSKSDSPIEMRSRSRSPEALANITRNDVYEAIFNSGEDLGNGDGKFEDSIGSDDYQDDFSDDVDNYNSRNDPYEISSPISVAKTDDDNFWDN